MGAEVLNFGCRLNIAEGEAIRHAASGLSNTTVVNSCAVTAEAVRQARQAARRAARTGRRVIVTGCAAQLDPHAFAAIPGVDRVLGNREKLQAQSFADGHPAIRADDIFVRHDAPAPVVSGTDHARAFVEVQTGCDHRCTFCIIPFARGNSVSAPADAIVEAVRGAIDRGHQEVVLTGVDATGYDGGLGPLVAKILDTLPDLPRLRLSSLDPVEIDPLLFDLITGEPRVMPHVHLSLQAGDDMILKRMKRRHLRRDATALVERIKARRGDVAVGADIIAGFPTEDDAMFANSLAIIADCDVVHGHIFPYSPRPGTPAARMPQVQTSIARGRAARLRAAVASRRQRWLDAQIGSTLPVLIERDGASGYTPSYAKVALLSREDEAISLDLASTVVPARILARDGDRLTGVPA